jgi:hypothetical protein
VTVIRIRFMKISDARHSLEIVRDDTRREIVECETRSYLMHDLLHYAVEAQASVDTGFWGLLSAGKTLADMNDRSGNAMAGATPALMDVERIVGGLSTVTKGQDIPPSGAIARAIASYLEAIGAAAPPWLTPAFVDGVRERMRSLVGRWKATPYLGRLELEWPDPTATIKT